MNDNSQLTVRDPGLDHDVNGVDVSLLRLMLTKSPVERLLTMERHARDVLQLIRYGQQHRDSVARSGR